MSDIFVIRNSDGSTEGRDPRAILVAEFRTRQAADPEGDPGEVLGLLLRPDWRGGQMHAANCALWPYRMRSNPFTLIFAIRSRDLGQWQAAMEPNATSCCGE